MFVRREICVCLLVGSPLLLAAEQEERRRVAKKTLEDRQADLDRRCAERHTLLRKPRSEQVPAPPPHAVACRFSKRPRFPC